MSDELVCVATFDKVIEARLCKSQLETEGIRSSLENEFSINANWMWNNALGGIRLLVSADDAERATAVLKQARHIFHRTDHDEPEEIAGRDESVNQAGYASTSVSDTLDDDDGPLQSEREDLALRSLMFAVAGMFIFPLQFFTLWVVWDVFTAKGPLRPLFVFYAVGAGCVAGVYAAAVLGILLFFVGAILSR